MRSWPSTKGFTSNNRAGTHHHHYTAITPTPIPTTVGTEVVLMAPRTTVVRRWQFLLLLVDTFMAVVIWSLTASVTQDLRREVTFLTVNVSVKRRPGLEGMVMP